MMTQPPTITMCGQAVGRGTVAQACELTAGHDGPHMSESVPTSLRERAEWVERVYLPSIAGPPSRHLPPPPPGIGSGVFYPPQSMLLPGAEREVVMLQDKGDITEAEFLSRIAMSSMFILWKMAQMAQDSGSPTLALTRLSIDGLIPPSLDRAMRAFESTTKGK